MVSHYLCWFSSFVSRKAFASTSQRRNSEEARKGESPETGEYGEYEKRKSGSLCSELHKTVLGSETDKVPLGNVE